jgi:integrase
MNIHFNLKSSANNSGETLILLFVSLPGQGRLRKSTGHFIKTGQWDAKQQRAKRGYKFQSEINEELDYLEREIKALIPLYRAKGRELTFQSLTEEVDKILKREKTTEDFFGLAERMKKRLELVNPTSGTPRNYNSVIKLVREYLKYKKQDRMAFDDFTHKWFAGFFEYCLTIRGTYTHERGIYKREVLKNLSEQSYAAKLKVIKAILKTAEKEGYLHCTDYKFLDKVKANNPDGKFIYLTEAEIKQLYSYKFKTEQYNQIRDILIFMSVTGLRISDIYNYVVKDDNFIFIKTKKTKKEIYIPYSYHPIAVDLIKKYRDKLPYIGASEFNRLIKLVCKEAGLKKWRQVSAHTGRRSLATNLFKREWPIGFIMQITGHTREEVFLQYIRMEKYEKAQHVLDFAMKNFAATTF